MNKFSIRPNKDSFLFKINREMLEKMIRITGIYLSLSHMFVAIAVPLYNIIVPTMRGIEYNIMAPLLILELFLLFLFVFKSSEKPRKEIELMLKRYFTKDQLLLGLLPLLYFISIVVNILLDGFIRYPSNSKYLFDILVNVFVTYPLGRYYVSHKIPKFVEVVTHILIIGMTFYMVFVLYKCFSGEIIKTFFRGTIGMQEVKVDGIPEYHLKVNSHHNTTGAFAGAFMLVCICMSVWKKGVLRILYIFAAFVHSIVLILANSRSTFIAGNIFLALYLGLIFYFFVKHKLNSDNKVVNLIIKWLLSIFVVIIAFVIMCFLRSSVFDVYKLCTDKEVTYEPIQSIVKEYSEEPLVEVRNLEVTNLRGREEIWSYAVQGIIINNRNMMIGVTPLGVSNLLGELSNGVRNTYTHNQILEIGVSFGLPGMFVFLIWLFFLANRCVIIGLATENQQSLRHKLIPLLVLFLVMFNMVEATLFFYNSFIGGLFMLSSAWCFEAVRSNKIDSKVFRIKTDFLQKQLLLNKSCDKSK